MDLAEIRHLRHLMEFGDEDVLDTGCVRHICLDGNGTSAGRLDLMLGACIALLDRGR
jgi:hypothetical protein